MTQLNSYLALAGAFIFMITNGIGYAWGTLTVYVTSYLRESDSSLTYTDTLMVFHFWFPFWIATKAFGPKLMDFLGMRGLAASVVGINTVLLYYASRARTLPELIFIFGILFATVAGIGYLIPFICAWQHFPARKGLMTGIVGAGVSCSIFIFARVGPMAANPQNSRPTVIVPRGASQEVFFTSDVAQNVPYMFKVMALVHFVFGVIGCLLMRPKETEPAVDHIQIPNSDLDRRSEDFHMHKPDEPMKKQETEQFDMREAYSKVLTPAFWILVVCGSLSSAYGLFILMKYKTFGLLQINDDRFLSEIGSWAGFAAGCMKLVWGLLMDFISFHTVYRTMILIQIVASFTLYYISAIKTLFVIWVLAILCIEGGHYVVFLAECGNRFGLKFGPFMFGNVSWAWVLGDFINALTLKLFLSEYGFAWMFNLYGFLMLIPLFLLQALPKSKIVTE